VLDFDCEQNVGCWIAQTSHAMRRALDEELAREGITFRQWEVLAWSNSSEELSQAELAERMGIEAPTLGGILSRMERDGWLARSGCPNDRRKKRFRPTPKAQAVWGRFDVVFTDPTHGWAVGEFSTTIRTTDGGKTWSVQTGAKRIVTQDPYFAIAFLNASNGLVLGLNGIEMQTSDGGNTWQAGTLPDQHRSFYTAVAAPSNGSDVYYVGGEDGITARLIDGKVIRTSTVTSNSITSIAFSSHFGIAVGLSGTVIRTEDDGQNWTELQGSQLVETRAQTGD
jgi:DNA-binding MarR family transcriptional regulator